MASQDTPQSLAAQRHRQAAARARAYRQRARLAVTIDEIVVDVLADALNGLRKGTTIDAFIRDVVADTIGRLKAAGVEKPRAVLGQRLSLPEHRKNEPVS